ncbi:MAG: hypothetical protein IM638_06765 [Bacteroidetes bacterium]|nr:hypothetical protein [Bacteroidota bacterium]
MRNNPGFNLIRSEVTLRFGLPGLLIFATGCVLLYFLWVAGIVLIVIGINLFLSYQKTYIDFQNKLVRKTNYAFFIPYSIYESFAEATVIFVFYELIKKSNKIDGFLPDPTQIKYFEIQFKGDSVEPVYLIEFPEYREATEFAHQLQQFTNLPVEDLYQHRLANAKQRRAERERKGRR